MISFSQSPFLLALGYAIINSLWQFGILWLIYLFINCLFKLKPDKKYFAAVLLQLTGFLWFVFTIVFYFIHEDTLIISSSLFTGNISYLNPSSLNLFFLNLLFKSTYFLPYLSIGYLTLISVLIIKWINALRFTNFLQKNAYTKVDVHYRLFIERICLQLGIKQTVKIFVSSLVNSPLTIGFLKPVILIPIASLNYLSIEQMEAVLLHELAHIKRFDYLNNILLSIIEVVLFFNPFMHILSVHIKKERENSCDDWVLQYDYNATVYAKALLNIAKFTYVKSNFGMNATDDNRALLGRVKRMIEKKDKTYNYRYQLMGMLIITFFLSVISWHAPQPIAATNRELPVEKIILPKPPDISSLSIPLFNPVYLLPQQQRLLLQQKVVELDKKSDGFALIQPAFINKPPQLNNENNNYKIPSTPSIDKIENEHLALNNNIKNQGKMSDSLMLTGKLAQEELNIRIINKEDNLKKNNGHTEITKAIEINKDKNGDGLIHLQIDLAKKDDAAQRYFIELYGSKLKDGSNKLIEQEFEKVIYDRSSPSEKFLTIPEVPKVPDLIFAAPHYEQAHIFSYDYNEKHKVLHGATFDKIIIENKKLIKKTEDGIFETEIINSKPVQGGKIKKVYKIIRI